MSNSGYGTSGGVELTNEVIERLAREAEGGYDVKRLRPRSRRGRPPIGSEAARLFQVRLEPELRGVLARAAQLQQTSPSEMARRALRAYLEGATASAGGDNQPGLPPEVLARIRAELGPPGDKVIDCLRTAAALITQARKDRTGLRLAESAAYNLREALDAVVEGRPALEGGIGSVLKAWRWYQIAIRQPGADDAAARRELDDVMERLEQDEERLAFKTRKLLGYVHDRTGIEPLPGEDDPTVRYSRLRTRANDTLHKEGTVAEVAVLYEEALAWFLRFFTPPDARVEALVALAEKPFAAGLIDQLRKLALNAHHLGLFFSRLQDPAWFDPLHDAGLIHLPRTGEPWPVASLASGPRLIDPVRIAEVLERLLVDANKYDKTKRLDIYRDILQTASRLEAAGHGVVKKVIAKYPKDHWVQMIAAAVARDADPTDPIQTAVADAVIGNEAPSDHGYYTRTILERLTQGLTAANAADRVKRVAAKIRRLAADKQMRFVMLDIAALTTPGDDLREPVLILAQYLTTMIPSCRHLGLSTTDLLRLIGDIDGDLGERITCQVLAGAGDIDREIKIAHIERRLASPTATGDDRDLINDILTIPLSPAEVARWRAALGQPSPPSVPDGEGDLYPGVIGDDWARAWRWSMVLPDEVLEGWEEAIAAVTTQHGEPLPTSLDTRIPRHHFGTGRSAYTAEELTALPVLKAAALVSAWRPRTDDAWPGVIARELARTLEAVVKQHPREWTEDPSAVVTTLREPVYVDHYFQAIADTAADLADRPHAVLQAVSMVRNARWEPAPIGRDNFEYEPDWSVVDTVIVEMIAAFANKSGELEADLDLCWKLATELVRRLPDELPDIETYQNTSKSDDPLNRAINRPYGKALQAVLALAGWEYRNHGTARGLFVKILDEGLDVPGAVGLELRSLLATHRSFIETVAPDWLDLRAGDLFGPTTLGTITFDQTLKWSRPTRWFYQRYQAELIAAARRGADHGVPWLLIGYLWNQPGYTFDTIMRGLAADVTAIKAAADEIALLMHDISAGDPMIERGVMFWEGLIDADRRLVPVEALVGLGRWTFVEALDENRWLELMDRTLQLTSGRIDMATEIADRCKEAQPSDRGLRMLRLMIGPGEPWQRHYVETAGVEALRTAAKHPVNEEFEPLRSRLIERGRHEAANITPMETSSR